MSRVLIGAAACTLALTGLVTPGAEAAWVKSGPGTAAAKAIKLVVPGTPTVNAKSCTGNSYSISLDWSYTGSLPPQFDIYAATNAGKPPSVIATATGTSVTLTGLTAKPAVVSVRASAGTWHSARSGEVAAC
ncbi:MAG TPA: hypothetical protein VGL47_06490 [Amycolatopsis sp.]|uniref:hypothetical protein n=1 Tax=Amycolatopsis sp. TaxID=37632 RepID=UPI002F3F15BA